MLVRAAKQEIKLVIGWHRDYARAFDLEVQECMKILIDHLHIDTILLNYFHRHKNPLMNYQ
jgi:hypothetical protein